MQEQLGGVFIESGASDWQIFQQDASGRADIALAGHYVGAAGMVQLRLVSEVSGAVAALGLDWQAAQTEATGRWSATLRGVPAGGLYRLETRLLQAAGQLRGDMRHFLGVGDLWVIAGQSNAAGSARGPVNDPPQLGVHLFRNSEQWALAAHPLNESTGARHFANLGAGNPGHAPYLQFGKLLQERLGFPIGLIATALGGSPLSDWNPDEGEAALFHNMVHCVGQAGGRVKGILWYQGESDGQPGLAESYGDRFAAAVAAWRAALSSPALPVITVQVNRFYQPDIDRFNRSWSIVREAQRQIPQRLRNVSVVPTLDLPLSDLVHTSPAGNMLLGERLAQTALGAVYGQPISYKAPDLQTARRCADGTVELLFANVSSALGSIDAAANPFRIEDETGDAPIVEVLYPGDNTVLLRLGRALHGAAVVHGAFGRIPATVPIDLDRSLPILGFYGVPLN